MRHLAHSAHSSTSRQPGNAANQPIAYSRLLSRRCSPARPPRCPSARSGSFAINPPFVPEMISALARHCTELLEQAAEAEESLSFVIIVGANEAAREDPAWQALEDGKFSQRAPPPSVCVLDPAVGKRDWCLTPLLVHRACPWAAVTPATIVSIADHGYFRGDQHMKRERRLLSTCDSALFFWQSPAAAGSWPVDPDSVGRLVNAFHTTKPERRGGQKVTPRLKREAPRGDPTVEGSSGKLSKSAARAARFGKQFMERDRERAQREGGRGGGGGGSSRGGGGRGGRGGRGRGGRGRGATPFQQRSATQAAGAD
jgi:hypothetical protein